MYQFDRDCITYTQEGRLLQLQYASKCVQSAETIVGLKCSDGVLLGAEKLLFSKLLVSDSSKRIFNIDKHIGMVVCGKIPDGKHVMSHSRNESQQFIKDFDTPINGQTLANRISLFLNAYTLYHSVRPFGSSEIFCAYNEDQGYQLFMLQPSGKYSGYKCCTAGRGRLTAKAEFEKTDFSKLTCRQALVYICTILIKSHEQSRTKKYVYEISWICEQSKNIHKYVPDKLIQQAIIQAKDDIFEQQMYE